MDIKMQHGSISGLLVTFTAWISMQFFLLLHWPTPAEFSYLCVIGGTIWTFIANADKAIANIQKFIAYAKTKFQIKIQQLMAQTKIGIDQANKPAPLWYRRLTNALIIFLIPATAALISGWGLKEKLQNRWLLVLTFLPAVIKGVGVVIGNGEYIKTYAPENREVID